MSEHSEAENDRGAGRAGRSEPQETGSDRSLHQQYEPEKPIHRAVNITSGMLKDRVEPFQHDEFDLWKARDPETGRESEHWWDTPEEAVEFLAHSIDLDLCFVNECDNYLGEDSDRLKCDECYPEEYVECAEDGCDYPTSHTATEHCSTHTWFNGREAEAEDDGLRADGGFDMSVGLAAYLRNLADRVESGDLCNGDVWERLIADAPIDAEYNAAPDEQLVSDGGVQQAADAEYQDALCPGCGVILTGSREPGDRGFCQEADRHVRFVEAMNLGELVDGDLETEEPLGETPADDVACADCGDYELLVGPLTFDGEVSEGADFVCRRCARKRALSTGGDRP